ncbi:MAG: hypothetical protein KTR32_16515 [Granulosicoccus sp.]|nr:hypothetical protein [Granulosicoccus sp.]
MDMSVNQTNNAAALFADADERCMAAIDAMDDMDSWDDDTPSQVFNHEIDAWARHAMAANGFGDL